MTIKLMRPVETFLQIFRIENRKARNSIDVLCGFMQLRLYAMFE